MDNEPQTEMTTEEAPKRFAFDKEKAIAKTKEVLNSKKTLTILILVFLVGAAFYFKDYFVVATVNGEPISRLAVIKKLEQQGGTATLDSMITEKLILSEAKKQGVSVTDDEVSQEIATIEEGIAAQGMTLEMALEQQGLQMESFKDSIRIQKTLRKLLGDKVAVTPEEVDKYIAENQMAVPAGQEDAAREQVTAQMENQKLSQEAQAYIDGLREQAKIQFYMKY